MRADAAAGGMEERVTPMRVPSPAASPEQAAAGGASVKASGKPAGRTSSKDPAQIRAILDFVAENKVPVFPRAARTKKAIISPQNASMREDSIRTWFGGRDRHDVGMPTGMRSGVVVIDCDVKKDKDERPILDAEGKNVAEDNGVLQFLDLCRSYGDEPSFVFQDTKSGGRHYFYAYDKATCADIPNSVDISFGGRKLNIDIKADGGCISIDPEGKTDETGRGYVFHGRIPEAPQLPDWLLQGIRNRKDTPPSVSGDHREIAEACATLEKAEPGNRNRDLNALAYFLGRRFAHESGAEAEVEAALCEAAARCGLPADEARRTCRSGFRAGVKKGPFRHRDQVPFFIRRGEIEADCDIDFADDSERDPLLSEEDAPLGILPPPPVWLLPEGLDSFCHELSKGKQIPLEMAFALVIALGSACVGRSRSIVYDSDWCEFANLYMIMISESGTGKSHAFDYVFKYVRKMETSHKMRYEKERRRYEEEYVVWKRRGKDDKKKEEAPRRPRDIQYLLDDATVEAMIDKLQDNPRGLFWFVDELHGFFRGLDRYNKNGAGEGKRKLLSAWDSKPISVTRKTQNGISQDIYLTRGTVGMYANIQPMLVPQLFSQDDVAQGWPQRFLYVRSRTLTPPTYPLPGIPQECDTILRKVTERLLGLEMVADPEGGMDAVPVYLSEAAAEAIGDYQSTLRNRYFDDQMGSYVAKLTKIVLRMALILHFLEWAAGNTATAEQRVSYANAIAAVKITDWFHAHTERIQHVLPRLGAGNGRADVSTGAIRLAKMILEHEKEIADLGGRVGNGTWEEWLREAGIVSGKRVLAESMKELHVETWRTSKERGKEVTPKAFAYCRAVTMQTKTMLSPVEESVGDYGNFIAGETGGDDES